MPALTRRRYPERPDCWHVCFGDVRVGTIRDPDRQPARRRSLSSRPPCV